MSVWHTLMKKLLPQKLAQDMEADSRLWMMRCPCGKERSIWDMGGIRYKAIGNSKHLMRCSQCGKITWHGLYKKSEPSAPDIHS